MKNTNATKWLFYALGLWLFSQCCGECFYDPGSQRWINRDPIQERGGADLYTFVDNAPLTRIDPYGRDGMDALNDAAAAYLAALCKCRSMISGAMHGAEDYAIAKYGNTSRPHATEGSTIDMLTHCIGACEVAKGQAACDGSGVDPRKYLQDREHGGVRAGDRNDLENNTIGFGIADSGKDCKQGCEQALKEGRLWTVRRRNGILIAEPVGPPSP
jgi:uncharacterized protein RhaS with RHS repeats